MHSEQIILLARFARPFGLCSSLIAIDSAIQRLKSNSAKSHHDGADDEQRNTAQIRHSVENGIWVPTKSDINQRRDTMPGIPSVVGEALLNPKPVAEGNDG